MSFKARILAAKSPKVFDFVFISEGEWDDPHKKGPHGLPVYITAEAIRAAVSKFESKPVLGVEFRPDYFNHLPDDVKREVQRKKVPLLSNIVGFTQNPRFEEIEQDGKKRAAVVGEIHVHDEKVANSLEAALKAGNKDYLGVSIDGTPRWQVINNNGKNYDSVWLEDLDTLDFVTDDARGGELIGMRIAASRTQPGDNPMKWTALQQALFVSLCAAAGIKTDAIAKLYGDGVDFAKDGLALFRAQLKDKPNISAKFEPHLAKLEKGEDIDATFTALSGMNGEFAVAPTPARTDADAAAAKAKADADAAAAKAKADAASDDPVAKANAILAQAEAASKKAEEANLAAESIIGTAEIEKQIQASRLPDAARDELKPRLVASRTFKPEAIKAEIDKMAKFISDVRGGVHGDDTNRILAGLQVGDASIDRIMLAAEGMFRGLDLQTEKKEVVPALRSFRELNRICGGREDEDMEKVFRRIGQRLTFNKDDDGLSFSAGDYVDARGRLTASISTADLPLIFGVSMHRGLLAEYASPDYQEWRKVCEIVSFDDLRNRTFQRFGGYGAAPLVAERGTYQMASSPSEEQVTLAIYKYGQIEAITEEMIINDDLRAVQRITRALGLGMAIDVFRMVFDPLTNNDAVSYGGDTNTWCHATHANGSASGGSALTDLTYDIGYQAMLGQAAYGNSRNVLGLMNKPKYLIVGRTQWLKALALTNPERLAQIVGTGASGFASGQLLPSAGIPNTRKDTEVIMLPHISTNNWWMTADPRMLPFLMVAFFNGKDTPELVTESNNSGAAFTSDQIRMKVKLRRGAVLSDHRAGYGQFV